MKFCISSDVTTTLLASSFITEYSRVNSLDSLEETPFAILETNLTCGLREGRRSGLMVSALDSGSSDPGSGPGRGHCVVFLGETLYSHGASLHPGV